MKKTPKTKTYFLTQGDFRGEITIGSNNAYIEISEEQGGGNIIEINKRQLYDLQDIINGLVETYEEKSKKLK